VASARNIAVWNEFDRPNGPKDLVPTELPVRAHELVWVSHGYGPATLYRADQLAEVASPKISGRASSALIGIKV
jgi:hypothetical protein